MVENTRTINTDWVSPRQKPAGASGVIEKRKGSLPVYMQLAQIIRSSIASGKLKSGDRIPTASKLAEEHGVSLMTVRQAVTVLVEEGLVKRVHGSGTFVRKVEMGKTSFHLDSLNQILSDTDHLKIQILKSDVERVQGIEGEMLGIKLEDPVILVERLIHYQKEPFALQAAYMPFDPISPVVEDMLDATGLSGLFFNENPSGYKKGSLRLWPVIMDQVESDLLMIAEDKQAFKLEYIYYNFKDKPCAYGWFIVPHENMPLISQIGVWNE